MRKLMKITILATSLFTTQGQAMEVPDEQTPEPDDIFMTIKNEHSETFPVRLRLNLIAFNTTQPYIMETEPIIFEVFNSLKVIKGHSSAYFTKSECIPFTFHLKAFNTNKPDKCELIADLIFNGFCYEPDKGTYNSIDHGIAITLPTSSVHHGQNYTIKATGHADHLSKLVTSFEVE